MRSFERRKHFRAMLPVGGRPATLEWENEVVEVRVVEESSGGFSVLTVAPLEKDPEGKTFLRFADRLAEVRVLRVQPQRTGTRLGLELVRDLNLNKRSKSPDADPKAVKAQQTKRMWMAGAGVVALGVLVALSPLLIRGRGDGGILSIVPFLRGPEVERVEMPTLSMSADVRRTVREHDNAELLLDADVSRLLGITPEQRVRIESMLANEKDSDSEASSLKKNPDGSPLTAVLNSRQQWRLRDMVEQSPSARDVLEQVAQHWPRAGARQLVDRLGPAALSLKRVGNELKLTADQRARIREIMEPALENSEELYRRAKAENAPELETQAHEALETARAEAMALLTPEQAAKLEPRKKSNSDR